MMPENGRVELCFLLDARKATAPFPVVVRRLLKVLGRVYGVRCVAVTWDPALESKNGDIIGTEVSERIEK